VEPLFCGLDGGATSNFQCSMAWHDFQPPTRNALPDDVTVTSPLVPYTVQYVHDPDSTDASAADWTYEYCEVGILNCYRIQSNASRGTGPAPGFPRFHASVTSQIIVG